MNCTVAPAEGWLPPAPKSFLRDIKAIWAGAEEISYYGMAQKWAFFLDQDTLITFYFTDGKDSFWFFLFFRVSFFFFSFSTF